MENAAQWVISRDASATISLAMFACKCTNERRNGPNASECRSKFEEEAKVQSISLPCFKAKGFIALRGYILEPYASSLAWAWHGEMMKRAVISSSQKQNCRWTNGPDRNAAAINGQCLGTLLWIDEGPEEIFEIMTQIFPTTKICKYSIQQQKE
jgi:hypothetical protein